MRPPSLNFKYATEYDKNKLSEISDRQNSVDLL